MAFIGHRLLSSAFQRVPTTCSLRADLCNGYVFTLCMSQNFIKFPENIYIHICISLSYICTYISIEMNCFLKRFISVYVLMGVYVHMSTSDLESRGH